MSVVKDFDPISGKLVPVTEIEYDEVDIEQFKADLLKVQTVPTSQPQKLVLPATPTGSPPGKINRFDIWRTVVTLFASLGGLTTIVQILQYFGAHPSELGQYGAQIAAVSIAVSQFVTLWQHDNTPRVVTSSNPSNTGT